MLEERIVLATFQVTTTDDVVDPDDGELSLREAIIAANENQSAATDTILLSAGTYRLSIEGRNEDEGRTGDLDILESVNIFGAGQDPITGEYLTVVDAGSNRNPQPGEFGIDRVFQIHRGRLDAENKPIKNSVSMTGIKISGGEADRGAGIFNEGTTTLIESAVMENFSTEPPDNLFPLGPAIHNVVEKDGDKDPGGLISFVNSKVEDNFAIDGQPRQTFLETAIEAFRTNQDGLTEGIDAFFTILSENLQSAIEEVREIPILGDQLIDATRPLLETLDTARNEVRDLIASVIDIPEAELEGLSPVELLRDTLFAIFGDGELSFELFPLQIRQLLEPLRAEIRALGLGILQDGLDTGPSVNRTDVLVTFGVDGRGELWHQLDVHLGQRLIFDLPKFDLGLSPVAEFLAAGNEKLQQSLEKFGFHISDTNGLQVDARWDVRLGLGISSVSGQQYYIDAGKSIDGSATGQEVEEFRLSITAYAAPAPGAEGFGEVFIPDPNDSTNFGFQADVNLGLMQAKITDGTPFTVSITTDEGIPLGIVTDYSTDFTVTTYDGNGEILSETEIHYDSPAEGEDLDSFLLGINATIIEQFTGETPENLNLFNLIDAVTDADFFISIDPRRINRYLSRPGAPTTPSLVIKARDPNVSAMKITGGTNLGFLDGQVEDGRARGVGFGNNLESVADLDTQMLTAPVGPPTDGRLLGDVDFVLWLGGPAGEASTQRVRINPSEAGQRRLIDSLGELRQRLESDIRDLVDGLTDYTRDRIALQILDGDGNVVADEDVVPGGDYRFQLVSFADSDNANEVLRAAPVLTVTYRTADQTKLEFAASIDVTRPDFLSTLLDDPTFANTQVAFNRVTKNLIETADSKFDLFVPSVVADAEIRLHVATNSDALEGFVEQGFGLTEGAIGLPSLEYDFLVDASLDFSKLLGDDDERFFEIGPLVFDNLRLDVSQLITSIVTPLANLAVEVLEPINNIGQTFDRELPVISDILDEKITLRSILGDEEADRLINLLENITEARQDLLDYLNGPQFLEDFGEDGKLELGGLALITDPQSPLFLKPLPLELVQVIEYVDEVELSAFLALTTLADKASSFFKIDLLKPEELFNFLTGNPFKIVSFGLPVIDVTKIGKFGFEFSDLAFDVTAAVDLDVNLRLVYDSVGLERLVQTSISGATPDFSDLLDGFLIQNNPEGPELGIGVEFIGSGSVDLEVFKASGMIDVGASLAFELADPNRDGALRIDEIFALTNDFQNPENLVFLFDLIATGHVTANGSAEIAGVDLGSAELGLVEGRFSLQDLLVSAFDIPRPPMLPDPASLIREGEGFVLRVNTGPFASARINGDTNDEDAEMGLAIQVTEDEDGQFTVMIQDNQSSDPMLRTGLSKTYSAPAGSIVRIDVVGTLFGDVIDLTEVRTADVQILAGAGDDQILGGHGDDVIDGGDGNDTIDGGDGSDLVVGGAGDDLIDGGDGNDELRGDRGDDELHGGEGGDRLFGGLGKDVLHGEFGNDLLQGDDGDDELHGGSGEDDIQGGRGNDTVSGDAGDDLIDGGSGDDVLDGGIGSDIIRGDRGDDELHGGSGEDQLYGDAGDDRIFADVGDDELHGGTGDDLLEGGIGNDLLLGHAGADELIGGDGSDRLLGGFGNDTLTAGFGDQLVQGNEGEDRLLIDDAHETSGATAGLGPATFFADRNGNSLGQTVFLGVEEIMITLGSGADQVTVTGTDLPLTVEGGTGDDEILIEEIHAATTIRGGEGNDKITVRNSHAPLTVDGGTSTLADVLRIDRTADLSPRQGVITSAEVSGFGLDRIAYAGVESLVFDLGSAADTVTIENTSTATAVTVNGGDGSDNVIVKQLSGPTTINGGFSNGRDDNGTDTATIMIAGNPATGDYGDLGFSLETLRIDNSGYSGNVEWTLRNRRIFVGDQTSALFDALGADTTVFIGGTGSNTLSIIDDSTASKSIEFEGQEVQIETAQDAVSFRQYAPESQSVITLSPDDRHVYSVDPSSDATEAISIYARDPATGELNQVDAVPAGRVEIGKLLKGNVDDMMGAAIDVSGNLAIIGAPFEGTQGVFAGAAYLYELVGTEWFFRTTIFSSEPLSQDRFGGTVAIDGNTIVIGSNRNDSGTDFVEIYQWNGTAATLSERIEFAASLVGGVLQVDVDGDTLVVGDPSQGDGSGRVLVYQHNGSDWQLAATLAPEFLEIGTAFGVDVELDGNRLIVGSRGEDSEGVNQGGAAYIFTRSAGGQFSNTNRQRLSPAGLSDFDFFGSSVAIDGDTAIVATSTGKTFVYGFNGTMWSLSQAAIQNAGSTFRVFLEGNVFLVGTSQGVERYERSSAGQDFVFTESLSPAGEFGELEPAIIGDFILVGVPDNDTNGNQAGAVILFKDITRSAASLTLSPDGEFGYLARPNDNAITVFRRNATSGRMDFVEEFLGIEGVRKLVVSPAGDFLYALGDTFNRIHRLMRDAETGKLSSPLAITTNLSFAQDLAVSPDHLNIYVSGNSGVSRILRTGDTYLFQERTQVLGANAITLSEDGMFLYVAQPSFDAISVFSRDPGSGQISSSPVQVLNHGVDGVQGLDGVNALAVTENGEFLFATGGEADSLVVFKREVLKGKLVFVQRLRDGSGGVQGLAGPTTIVISQDNRSIYVGSVGRAPRDGGIAVFDSSPLGVAIDAPKVIPPLGQVFSALEIDDRIGRGEIAEVRLTIDVFHENPGSLIAFLLSPQGTQIPITSALLTGEVLLSDFSGELPMGQWLLRIIDGVPGGGFGLLNSWRLEISLVGGNRYQVEHQNIPILSLESGAGNDTVAVHETAGLISLGIDTQGGADLVSVQTTPPSFTAHLGDGEDTFHLFGSGSPSSVTVQGGGGNDILNLWATGFGLTTAHGESGDDLIRVAGTRIHGPVLVDGGSHVSGDALSFDAQNLPVHLFDAIGMPVPFPSIPNGTVGVVQSEFQPVTYRWIENFDFLAAPTARVNLSAFTLVEGAGVTLSGAESSPPPGRTLVAYEWDLNGDGEFGDVLGQAVNLTWQELSAFGIDDDGTYQVALKVTTETGAVDVETAILNVGNAPPTLMLAGAALSEEDEPYTLSLSAFDFGNDTIERWEVDWGDGSNPETFLDRSAVISHVYANPGDYTVTVRAFDEDNRGGIPYFATQLVQVNAVAPTIRELGGEMTIEEGATYPLDLRAAGPRLGEIDTWTISWGDGTIDQVPGHFDQVTHVYADDGVYTITAVVSGSLGTFEADNRISVRVTNVAPQLTLAGAPSVTEGLYTLDLSAGDPGDDTIARWQINWGDGVVETLLGNPSQATHIFDGDTDGTTYHITAQASDEDGTFLSNALDVTVANAAPTIQNFTLLTPNPAEGGLLTVFASASDVAGPLDPLFYEFDFDGDAVFDVASRDGHASFLYPDEGSKTVTVRISDGDGGTVESTIQFLVANRVPTLALRGEAIGNEGQSFTLNLDVTDPGEDLVDGYTIDWGDGTVEEYAFNGGLVDLAPTHLYADGDAPRTQTFEISAETANANETFTLDLSALDHPAGPDDLITFWTISWGDGSVETVAGDLSTAVHSYALAGSFTIHATSSRLTTYTIRILELSDEDGDHAVSATFQVAVRNTPPTIELGGEDRTTDDATYRLELGEVSDPGQDTVQGFVVDWGDGQHETFERPPVAGETLLHHYGIASGPRTIRVLLIDEDGTHLSLNQLDILVVGGDLEEDGILRIYGTSGKDVVSLKIKEENRLEVKANFFPDHKREFDLNGIQAIEIYLGDGNDHLLVHHKVKIPVTAFGESGNDHLHAGGGPAHLDGGEGNDLLKGGEANDILIGGKGEDLLWGRGGNDVLEGGEGHDLLWGDGGNDILDGGLGNDLLYGDQGRDLLIGGAGLDLLAGGQGDDLLIGGTVQFATAQEPSTALAALLAEWTSERTYEERVNNLSGTGTGERANENFFLIGGTTVLSDPFIDLLFGGLGQDWAFWDDLDLGD